MIKLALLIIALNPVAAFSAPKIQNADIKAAAAIDATKLIDGSVSNTELGYINTLSSNAQTQLNGKQASGNYITDLTGDVTASGPGSVAATIANLAVTNGKIANSTIDLTAKVTGTLPVANGGTGQTSYTNGQLLIGNTTGNTLAKATLTAGAGVSITNGAGSITIDSTGGGALPVRTETAGYSITTSDSVIRADLTGGAFTLSLPSAASSSGSRFTIMKSDSSLNVGLIDADGTDTIGQNAAANVHLNTQGESWTLISDGVSNWIVEDHYAKTAPATFTQVINGSGANPSKGGTAVDTAYFWREGQWLNISWDYRQTSGGSGGTGDYLFVIPNSSAWTINTSIIPANTTANMLSSVGNAWIDNSTAAVRPGQAIVYSSTALAITASLAVNSTIATWGSAQFGGLGQTNIVAFYRARVPITNWEE